LPQNHKGNAEEENDLREEGHTKAHEFEPGTAAVEWVRSCLRRSDTVQRDGGPGDPDGRPDDAAAECRAHLEPNGDKGAQQNH
jgi:hypothetical protein